MDSGSASSNMGIPATQEAKTKPLLPDLDPYIPAAMLSIRTPDVGPKYLFIEDITPFAKEMLHIPTNTPEDAPLTNEMLSTHINGLLPTNAGEKYIADIENLQYGQTVKLVVLQHGVEKEFTVRKTSNGYMLMVDDYTESIDNLRQLPGRGPIKRISDKVIGLQETLAIDQRPINAQKPLAAILADLNELKKANDGPGGHQLGDAYLAAVVVALKVALFGRQYLENDLTINNFIELSKGNPELQGIFTQMKNPNFWGEEIENFITTKADNSEINDLLVQWGGDEIASILPLSNQAELIPIMKRVRNAFKAFDANHFQITNGGRTVEFPRLDVAIGAVITDGTTIMYFDETDPDNIIIREAKLDGPIPEDPQFKSIYELLVAADRKLYIDKIKIKEARTKENELTKAYWADQYKSTAPV